ncbi:MAG: AAA family ATPase [archaeon]|nr:AAA family ATPase [archaeon]
MQENGPKAVPAGIADFKEIRKSGYYFVDKSEIISDILKDRAKAYLFTRPRRFGKSMNLSMLDAFFNVKYAGNGWFDDLKVSGHPEVEKHKNVYPVVNLDMKDLPTDDYGEFVSGVGLLVSNLYNDHGYLEDFLDDPVDSDRFERARRQRLTKGELRESLRFLCKLLKSHHGVSPIVLIDEYDDAVNNSSDKDSYEGILGFLSGLYSSTLKGNDCLKFAVVTGVMQIGKGSICTGINNLKIDNMFTEQFDERFGFTASEVGSLCEHYGHGEKFDEMRRWYGGYRFGNAEIFNPRSVLNYVGAGFKPGVYRADTDGNDVLDHLIGCSNLDTYRELQSLTEGRPVKKSLSQVITLHDMDTNHDAIFPIMVATGHLNAIPVEDDCYELSIPNMEMREVFSSILR